MQTTTVKDVIALYSEFDNLKPIWAFDTETSGLDLATLEMVGYSICDGERAFYVPLDENISGWNEKALKVLEDNLLCCKGIVMHNAKFDLEVLKLSGINYEGDIFCTQTAAHLIDENRPKGLKDLAVFELDVREVESFQEASQEGLDTERFYKYAQNDAVWTYQLYEKFKCQLKDRGLIGLFSKIEMPFQFVLAEMELEGVYVDQEMLKKLEKEVREKLNQIIINMCGLVDIQCSVQQLVDGTVEVKPSVNFNSTKQLVDIFENKLGIEITETTKKGNKSLDHKSLTLLKGRHPFVDYLLQYKIGRKCYESFISPLPDFIDKDGRVRANFNNCVCTTGRLSSSKPNLQQLPKTKEEFPIEFRKVFAAPEGRSLLALDYSGQELCVLAHVSNDPFLIKALTNDYDLHLITANEVFELGLSLESMNKKASMYIELKEKYDNERHKGKNGINFPIVYGTTAYGISKNLGVTEKQAQKYIDGFFKLYPDIKKTIKKCTQSLWKKGYVRSGVGRYRHLNPKFNKSHRQAFNFLIQGLSADMIRLSMVKIREHLKEHPEYEAKQVMTIHDEIVIEVKDEYAEQLFKEAKEIMESVMTLRVPLKVEGNIAKNYGDAK